ncbi:MAG: MOSC domain-containing protein [Blastocatellia bacterium]|nr:MOSC domain-containing protein [Blastocatellia bacterium]
MSAPIGKIKGIYLGSRKGEGKRFRESAELIPEHGLRGDSHAGRDPDRQVSLFSSEVLSRMQAEGFKLSAEDLSTNFLTEDFPLDSFQPGTQLHIGETVIELVEARRPCRSITKIDNRLPKRLYGECGQMARIIKGGVVRIGDEIEMVD